MSIKNVDIKNLLSQFKAICVSYLNNVAKSSLQNTKLENSYYIFSLYVKESLICIQI